MHQSRNDCVKADIRSIIEVMSARIETIIVVTRTTIIMHRTFLRSFAPSKSSQLTAWPMMSPLQRTLLDEFSRGATPTWPNTYLQCNVTTRVLLSSFCNLVSPIFPLPPSFPLLLCRFPLFLSFPHPVFPRVFLFLPRVKTVVSLSAVVHSTRAY